MAWWQDSSRRQFLKGTLAAGLGVWSCQRGRLVHAQGSGPAPGAGAPPSEWEITPSSELALERGLVWLARNQGNEGNWDSNDLGLVAMGALAFLAAGHTPDRASTAQRSPVPSIMCSKTPNRRAC